jgi:acetyl esterase/lipase
MLGDYFDRLAHGSGRGNSPSWMLEACMPHPPLTLHDGVPYGSHPRQRLDLYLPPPRRRAHRLVVFLYGGGWDAGARGTYRFLAQAMVACGFAVAVPDYRIYPEARFPDFLHDSAAAVGWLQRHATDYGFDGSRMALMGHSAGAYNAAAVALDPSYLEQAGVPPELVGGVVGLAGPYALNPLEYQETREIFAPSRSDPSRAHVVRLVRPHAPPMLLAHGGIDRRVLPINSLRLAEAMRAAGNDVRLRLYPRHGHVGLLLALANPFRWLFRALDDTVEFLDGILAPRH